RSPPQGRLRSPVHVGLVRPQDLQTQLPVNLHRAPSALAIVALGVALFAPARASADGATPDCPTASEQGQRLRDDGKYLRARDMFRQCSRDSCPGVVRKDCSKWLAQIEDSMPTLVVSARDEDGKDVSGKVLVDGEVAMTKLEGKPLTVDPGEH